MSDDRNNLWLGDQMPRKEHQFGLTHIDRLRNWQAEMIGILERTTAGGAVVGQCKNGVKRLQPTYTIGRGY
jgi:hypothetical protein